MPLQRGVDRSLCNNAKNTLCNAPTLLDVLGESVAYRRGMRCGRRTPIAHPQPFR